MLFDIGSCSHALGICKTGVFMSPADMATHLKQVKYVKPLNKKQTRVRKAVQQVKHFTQSKLPHWRSGFYTSFNFSKKSITRSSLPHSIIIFLNNHRISYALKCFSTRVKWPLNLLHVNYNKNLIFRYTA